MRLANVEALKRRLGDGEVIPYADLLRACEEAGAARTRAEAAALAGALDEAGVVLLFRDKVYLQPDKVSIAPDAIPPPPPNHPSCFSVNFDLERLGSTIRGSYLAPRWGCSTRGPAGCFREFQRIFGAPDECFDEYHYELANSFPVVSIAGPHGSGHLASGGFCIFPMATFRCSSSIDFLQVQGYRRTCLMVQCCVNFQFHHVFIRQIPPSVPRFRWYYYKLHGPLGSKPIVRVEYARAPEFIVHFAVRCSTSLADELT
jgi:hypothetical protein